MRRASSWSLFFGILALLIGILAFMGLSDWLGFGAQPDSTWEKIVGVPVLLGFVCGLAGVLSGVQRRRAIAGIALSAVWPWVWVQLQHRHPNWAEAGAVGDVRTVISAQHAYTSANAGPAYTSGDAGPFGPLECLSQPSACIPGYRAIDPTFLDSMLASGQPKSGYNRTFFAGPPAKGLSASSMASFAYVAVPINPEETGYRAFCGDAAGMICATADGSMPLVRDARCVVSTGRWFRRASDCVPLQ